MSKLLERLDDGTAAAGNLRVLAAEDHPTNQLVLKTQLGAVGIEPLIVGDGQEAVQAFKNGRWDIVLMDIQMPVMDGIGATRAIRQVEREQGWLRTPILAVTANAMAHQRAEYLAAGLDGVVTKPVSLAVLLQAMDQALDFGDAAAAPAARAVN